MKKIGKIYIITNTVNNKVYIGQTIQSIQKRFREHVCGAVTKNKKQPLYASIRKYGRDKFKIEILKDDIEAKDLNKFETEYIIKYDSVENGFNLKYRERRIRSVKYNVEDIIKRYENKESLKDISKDYKCDKRTLSNLLKENGIEIRNWNKEQSKDVTKEQLEEMFYERNLSPTEIAKEIGLSRTAIINWFDKFGIPRTKQRRSQ
jgi:group I intron endonuclease